MSFDSLGLTPELVRAVADEGYTQPTPIQLKAIPLVLEGRDLLAAAQTGTGKTAAFVLPLIQRLHATAPAGSLAPTPPPAPRVQPGFRTPPSRGFRAPTPALPARALTPIRALVLAPTRELALQVEESFRTYGRHQPIRSVAIYGGVGFDPQVRALRAGPTIVVATPGRLLDHVMQGTIDLSKVEHLVLDEADRMLDMGFIRDIRKILDLLPRQRQNLLFSATFSNEIRSLAAGLLNNPASVDVAPRNTPAELVDQLVIPVDRGRKVALLTELYAQGRVKQALVFARTKHGANRLAEQLDDAGIKTAAIHGNKSQPQRVRALDDFKAGRVSFLVATDIAARGIDIDSLPHVINYEMPMVPEDYVHRIGRTGRAGVDGQAISLVCVDEAQLLREIQGLLRRTIPSEVIPGFEPDRNARPEPIRLRSGEVGHGGGRPSGRGGGRPSAPRQAGSRDSLPGRSQARPGEAGPSRPITRPAPGHPAAARPGVHPSSSRPAQGRPGTSFGQAPARGPVAPHRGAGPTVHRGQGPSQGYGSRPPEGQRYAGSDASGQRPQQLPGERLRRAEQA